VASIPVSVAKSARAAALPPRPHRHPEGAQRRGIPRSGRIGTPGGRRTGGLDASGMLSPTWWHVIPDRSLGQTRRAAPPKHRSIGEFSSLQNRLVLHLTSRDIMAPWTIRTKHHPMCRPARRSRSPVIEPTTFLPCPLGWRLNSRQRDGASTSGRNTG
jgi:hypothetical protein